MGRCQFPEADFAEPDSRRLVLAMTMGIESPLESSPDLVCHLDDHPQLRPLLLFGEHITVLGRRKAALRRQAELIDGDEFCRFVDAALEFVAAFERTGLRSHESEHDLLALRHETERLRGAGACGVAF